MGMAVCVRGQNKQTLNVENAVKSNLDRTPPELLLEGREKVLMQKTVQWPHQMQGKSSTVASSIAGGSFHAKSSAMTSLVAGWSPLVS